MANNSDTEITAMKAASVKLDNDTIFILGYFAHTEKHARDKSEYLYAGRIDKISDLEAEANDMNLDSNKLKKWEWKGLPKYKSVVYDGFDTNARGSKWLNCRIKKATNWNEFSKILKGWKKNKNAFNENARYPTVDYILDNGEKIPDLLAEGPDKLKTFVGHTLLHKVQLKSQLPAE